MIHIYYGDGKGKTTAAMGLALRMAGRGRPVVIAQFLKSENSGERRGLEQVEGVTLLPLPQSLPFLFEMTPEQREGERRRLNQLLDELERQAQTAGLLVLDEVCDAVEEGLVEPGRILALLDRTQGEAVLTGRNARPELLARADYVTRMEKVRHPFDRGISARTGVEW